MNGFSITLPEMLSIIGLAITTSGIFGTVLWNLWRRVMANSITDAVHHQEITDNLNAFKLQVAEKYVSGNRLADMEQKMLLSEERVVSSMVNLTSRIDRMLERMENRQ